MVKLEVSNEVIYVIIGGGVVGVYVVEGLCEVGFIGCIVLFFVEEEVFYDWLNCSKDYLQGEVLEEWMLLWDVVFYKKYGIVFMKG